MADDETDDLGLPDEGDGVEFPEDAGLGNRGAHGGPGRKTASREEQDAITCFAAMLLSQEMTTADVKKQLQKRYAMYNFSPRSAEKYIHRAKEKVAEWSGLNADTVRSQIVAMLQGLTRGHLKVGERLAVLDRLVLLFGLNAPAKFAETNADGSDLTDDERKLIRAKILARLGLRTLGQDGAGTPGDPDRSPLAGPSPGHGPERDAGGPVAGRDSAFLGSETDNPM